MVHGARYGVRGARHEVQNTLYDYPTKPPSPRNMSTLGRGCEVQSTRYEERDTGCEV